MNETPMTQLEQVIEATGAIAVESPVKTALVRDLGPIAERIPAYVENCRMATVTNTTEANDATVLCDNIAADIKTVEKHEVMAGIVTGLHQLHRRWTGLRDAFTKPMDSARREMKAKVIAWQENERLKAEAEQRRLQAEADEKARKERERLEKEAAKLKTPEKREAKMEAAAQVIAPTVHVEAPKTSVRVSRRWVALVSDAKVFVAACATRPELLGYVEISATKLARAKAANQMFDAPGVEFKQEIV